MAYLKQVSLGLSLAAVAGMAAPALAHNHLAELELAQNPVAQEVTTEIATEPVVAEEVPTAEATIAEVPATAEVPVVEAIAPVEGASLLTLPEAEPLAADNMFNTADIESALLAATVETAPEASDSIDLAQTTTSGSYATSPAYLGIGGNLGIIADDSAIGDFGLTVISKISLGPRFSLRPGFIFSENYTSLMVPLTYNFNTLSLGGFRVQPYVGGGVDIPFGEDVGILLDAGADIPISRAFTINTAANFRVSGGFNLGVMFGVAYNFPFIFE